MENMENSENQENTQPEEIVVVESVEEIDVIPAEASAPAERKIVISRKALIITGIVIVVLVLAYFVKGLIVAATVNGSPIRRAAVISELERSYGKDTLDSLIRERLIINEAKKKGITVSEDEINEELKKVEETLSAQGTTLDEALAEQGMTRDMLRQRIIVQKKLTKQIEGKGDVTDEEVEEYIKTNSITLTKDKEAEEKTAIKEQIKNSKLSEAAAALVDQLMADAKINYWVKY